MIWQSNLLTHCNINRLHSGTSGSWEQFYPLLWANFTPSFRKVELKHMYSNIGIYHRGWNWVCSVSHFRTCCFVWIGEKTSCYGLGASWIPLVISENLLHLDAPKKSSQSPYRAAHLLMFFSMSAVYLALHIMHINATHVSIIVSDYFGTWYFDFSPILFPSCQL